MERLGSQSLLQLKTHVEFCVDTGDLSGALDILRHFTELVINDPAAVAHVLASAQVDGLCRFVAHAYREQVPVAAAAGTPVGTVILMTDANGHGGHIELAKDLVRTDVLGPCTIVLTDSLSRAEAVDLGLPGVRIEIVRAGTSAERLRRLDQLLQALQPERIVALVHHQDSTAVAALLAQPEPDHVYFVHHADHNLCLGATERAFRHVDLHPMGFHACRSLHGRQNIYWPLTVRSGAADALARGFLGEGAPVTATSGREAKFDASGYLYDYYELLPRMLLATRGRHVHFGPMSEHALARIRVQLEMAGIEATRFKHVPWVNSIATALVQENVDLYLPSFPLGGGKTVIEAMSAGIPLLMHENYHHRLLSGVDLGYPDAFVWRDDAELLETLRQLSQPELERHSRLARTHFERHHRLDALARAVESGDDNAAIVPPLRPYLGNDLQAFLDEKQRQDQVSVTAADPAGQQALAGSREEIKRLSDLNEALVQHLGLLQAMRETNAQLAAEIRRQSLEIAKLRGGARSKLRALWQQLRAR